MKARVRDTEDTKATHRYHSDVTDTAWNILGHSIESGQFRHRFLALAMDFRGSRNAICCRNKVTVQVFAHIV